MLTNKLLADYQNYDEVLKILGTERFRDETDPVYQFFKLKVKPIRHALEKNDVCALMEVLGRNFPPINNIGDLVFRNKDKISYTSLFYINKDIYILFDRITKKLRICGVYKDPFINTYPFVNKVLKDLCCICNEYTYETKYDCLRRIGKLRYKYICSDDKTIYGDILHNGDYKYNIDGNFVYAPELYTSKDDINLVIEDNYMNFILPLIQSLF